MPVPRKLLLVGPPGSGKSFYGAMMSKLYGIPFVSMGKVLKREMSQRVKDDMLKGKLAPPEEVGRVFRGMADTFSKGMVLDGFPRSLVQVGMFVDAVRQDTRLKPDLALHFTLCNSIITEKMLGRRECSSCGSNWNVADIDRGDFRMSAVLPPSGSKTVCSCGKPFEIRADDSVETIKDRLQLHDERWKDMEAPLREAVKVVDVPIIGGQEVMWPIITKAIEDHTAA